MFLCPAVSGQVSLDRRLEDRVAVEALEGQRLLAHLPLVAADVARVGSGVGAQVAYLGPDSIDKKYPTAFPTNLEANGIGESVFKLTLY